MPSANNRRSLRVGEIIFFCLRSRSRMRLQLTGCSEICWCHLEVVTYIQKSPVTGCVSELSDKMRLVSSVAKHAL